MIKRIIETTDGKYIGLKLDTSKPIVLNGVPFEVEKIQDIGSGLTRYSNSQYIILTKEV